MRDALIAAAGGMVGGVVLMSVAWNRVWDAAEAVARHD